MKVLRNVVTGGLLLFVSGMNAQSPVVEIDREQGALSGRNIVLWQSHGRYYDKTEDRWKWQRCRLFGTVEDLYTRSYVVPFLVPMLENAGAYVMLPRERDEQVNELIIDRDGNFTVGEYTEHNGKHKWKDGKTSGFALNTETLSNGDNPFEAGHWRMVKSVTDPRKVSTARWNAAVPERGDYAVYISFRTTDKSADDVTYVVHTAAGPRKFRVDQRMGGGTWLYLGTFPFAKSESVQTLVSVSNLSAKEGATVSADAVRIGGGMGSVARSTGEAGAPAHVSGMPRWAEGARYYLQYAGMPDSVYAHEGDDYRDDIFARPMWVNHLKNELNIPVDLAMAFHSDAGTAGGDTVVGTLGIYYTARRGKFPDGRSRNLSGALADSIVNSVVRDIRSDYNPSWVRRKMRDAKYIEARVPEVPTMLLELLSHQNLADMRYGLDPQFKFDVSRAVYKGILRYLAAGKLAKYVVEPLAPHALAIEETIPGRFRLSWQAQIDSHESSAMPKRYMIEERVGADCGEPFHTLAVVTDNDYFVEIPAGEIRSYRVVAVNSGGRSFPSEVISAGHVRNSKGMVTIVNGFTRVSAPDNFDSGTMAGFGLSDPGVPMVKDLSFTGRQYEFDKSKPWVHDDQPGFGASRANMETKPVWGNTFDFIPLHGEAIMNAGYSFVSTSVKAFIESSSEPDILDLQMGLQRETVVGSGGRATEHQVFPVELQMRLEQLAANGVPMFLSGAYVATDLQNSPSATSMGRDFARDVFGFEWRTDHAAVTGAVSEVRSRFFSDFSGGKFLFGLVSGGAPYEVASPDALYPYSPTSGATVMRYDENQTPAAVAYVSASHRTISLGFPFESICSRRSRDVLMKQILNYLTSK